ncbi:hypothetical protein L798_00542 [Zootermopsis nevadensis]|uniref:Uncharacterized protein n=1 Tax=Zootermopsis nevadensis TaxID=136037 RepID=A0A067QLF0_ZOONE|nr:hypothetical protein L798_00542 [Zootermopsis nevadensis]
MVIVVRRGSSLLCLKVDGQDKRRISNGQCWNISYWRDQIKFRMILRGVARMGDLRFSRQ